MKKILATHLQAMNINKTTFEKYHHIWILTRYKISIKLMGTGKLKIVVNKLEMNKIQL